jgi:hypothetical protein
VGVEKNKFLSLNSIYSFSLKMKLKIGHYVMM